MEVLNEKGSMENTKRHLVSFYYYLKNLGDRVSGNLAYAVGANKRKLRDVVENFEESRQGKGKIKEFNQEKMALNSQYGKTDLNGNIIFGDNSSEKERSEYREKLKAIRAKYPDIETEIGVLELEVEEMLKQVVKWEPFKIKSSYLNIEINGNEWEWLLMEDKEGKLGIVAGTEAEIEVLLEKQEKKKEEKECKEK
jgi:hypothetical protein